MLFGFYPIIDGAKEVKAGYDLASRKGLLNQILFMVDLKLYGKNKKHANRYSYKHRSRFQQ